MTPPPPRSIFSSLQAQFLLGTVLVLLLVMAAVIIVAELGDMRRFGKPRQLMGYLGLVPSEHSSGESTRA